MQRVVSVHRFAGFTVAAIALLGAATAAKAQPSYSGASGVLPTQAPWNWGYQALNLNNPLTAPVATATAGGSVTILNTSGQIADAAGFTTHVPNLLSPGFAYVHPNLIPLDRSAGFEVDFTLRVLDEQHGSADRAGFSVTVLSSVASPGPPGIELGFWKNEVWAQNAGFTHGESSGVFDTTTGLIPYRLLVSGNSYQLLANGNQILSGNLRDYSAFSGGPPFNTAFPYNQTNFTFFGDDTSSASASVQIASIQVVPEPGAILLGVVGFAGVCGLLNRKWCG
jgi:hypothetical protein